MAFASLSIDYLSLLIKNINDQLDEVVKSRINIEGNYSPHIVINM
jgi:hypothetical protein